MNPGEENWCILRCQGRATLRLAATLAKDGFDVWTPRETRRIRIPRANIRREAVLPLLPSYVFAKVHHLVDLLQLAAMPVKPRRGPGLLEPAHASFTVMRHNDMIPLVADRSLDGLRYLETKRTPRKKADPLPTGAEVRVKMEGGSFAGMKGVVQRSDDGHTLLCIDKRMTVKIPTSLLDVHALQTTPLVALRAA